MGYDLSFWKYKADIYLDNQEVYEHCLEDESVDGLEDLPIKNIVKDISTAFSDWTKLGEFDFENPNGRGTFGIITTHQFVKVEAYGMSEDDMNKFIDVLLKYNCPLYRPQVPQRYDGK